MHGCQRILTAILPIALVFMLAAPAHNACAVTLSGVGLANFTNPTFSTTSTTGLGLSGGATAGFGLLASSELMPGFVLEIGALWVPRKFSNDDSSGQSLSTTNAKWLEVPLLLRFTGLPLVSIGIGPYYAHGLGNVVISQPATPDTSVDYSAVGQTQNDFGLEGSVGARIPVVPQIGIVADLRYLFGLINQSSLDNTTVHYRSLELLFGISIDI